MNMTNIHNTMIPLFTYYNYESCNSLFPGDFSFEYTNGCFKDTVNIRDLT